MLTHTRISVLIPALNEESMIVPALESVEWATEVVVIDSGSSDRTAQIAREHGARVERFEYDGGSEKKKGWALQHLELEGDWILILDADERVTSALRDEILSTTFEAQHSGYCIDREFHFLGRELRCFRPNWNLRLFRNGKGRMEDLGLHQLPDTGDNEIHEQVVVDGSIGYLAHPLLHDDYRGITQWIDKHNRYATWEAHLYLQLRQQPIDMAVSALADPLRRKRVLRRLWVRLPARPILRFLIWYGLRRGFVDGLPGLTYCALMGWYELLIGIKVRELRRSDGGREASS